MMSPTVFVDGGLSMLEKVQVGLCQSNDSAILEDDTIGVSHQQR